MDIRQVISPEQQYSFLAGAGVSFDSPSNLPIARGIVYGMLDVLNIEEVYRSEFKRKFDTSDLRFEQFIEQIVRSYDDEGFKLFDALSDCRSPNRIHHFLANIIKGGYRTFTTNFDTLIEQAGQNITCSIESIYDEESALSKKDMVNYPLYKLHGTLNDEKGADCRKSIVALISSMGKMGEAFALSPYFKTILTETIQSSPLIVLGYSGSDDYDILPALAQIDLPTRIIWIHHSNNTEDMGILNSSEWEKLPDPVRRVLDDLISLGYWSKEKLIVLIGNTSTIVDEIEKILLPNAAKYIPQASYKIPDYFYEDWKFQYAIEAWRDKQFIANIYHSLGEYPKAIPFLQSALQDVESLSETAAQVHLHFNLAEINLRMRNPEMGRHHIDQVIKLTQGINLPDTQKYLINEYNAIYYTEIGDLAKAERMFQNSSPDQTDQSYAGYLYALSQIVDRNGDHEQARSLVDKSLSLNRQKGNLNSVIYCLHYLAKTDIENGDYRAALNSILEAIRICNLTHNFALLANCYEIRSQLYRKLGLLGKAFEDLSSAMQLYESRIQNIHDQAVCCANIASVLHRIEGIRVEFQSNSLHKIKGHYIEGMGCYYSPSDMPALFTENALLTDGYILSNGKKISTLDGNFSGLFAQLSGSSIPNDSSLGLVLEDEFPDEAISSKEYAMNAIKLAKDSGEESFVEKVVKLVTFDLTEEDRPRES